MLAVNVDDTQSVERGQVLAVLDPADARVAIDGAEAELARAVRNVRGLFAQREQLQAQIAQRDADLSRAQDDLGRRQDLLADGAVSGEELSHARDAVAVARAALDAAREQLNATEAQIQGTTIATHPQVLAAEAAVRNAALALRRTRAARAGGRRDRQAHRAGRPAGGRRHAADGGGAARGCLGRRQFQGSAAAQHARRPAGDAARRHLWRQRDLSTAMSTACGAGSGSAFALLPPQNASGNWIKIVQRVPVRIALDPQELKAHPLRVGLSMTARSTCTTPPARWSRARCAASRADTGQRGRRSRVAGTHRPDRAANAGHDGSAAVHRAQPARRAATAQAQPVPLAGARAGDHRAGAGARHLHAGAGYHHRQRLAADHRRQSGRQRRPGHLGDHLLRRRQRHRRCR